MTVGTNVAILLARGAQRLAAGHADGAATAALDAGLLLAHVLDTTRARLIAYPEAAVAAADQRRYHALLERRAAGVPLAYLTGVREFWSLPLHVSPAVLVPRPQTELLVERALAVGGAAAASAADLGTGCGAVALALASERPQWRIVATDVSAAALEVARGNARRLGLVVQFRHGDWFTPLADERYDLLLSNPPYVAEVDPALHALRYEPRAALTPGLDALQSLRTLVRGAPPHLLPGGWLLLEHGPDQGAKVRRALVLAGFRSVRSHRDFGGHERITEGQHDQI